ncbi:MucB/RseB C-terminal domain-containing protein [Teredinibacter sp. KSP-S5-2]|uniref:MucB/RseB C-terminal domain-containing protein n=1 Tax=Teredinibacter sp. KSP-S5-2 TaxID=3034506 RepID=UPI00293490E8|nr:MucB/RseB C-terminal domain-containing protein [Teredinibacter sp. KSP-S5-2]WNO08019.1 MucB/RseB C-terminal domain-containing protein [Teredinibacter sp. KSP-S5-2]
MSKHIKQSIFVFLSFISFEALAQGGAQELPSIPHLLSKLAQSSEAIYQGTLTYESQGAISSVNVSRVQKDGRIYENVERLDGPQRHHLFAGEFLDCMSPGNFLIRGGVFKNRAGDQYHLSKNYELVVRGRDRVAGRIATVIQFLPKDDFRFALTMVIDEDTGVLLKSLVSEAGNKVLERFQFVTIDFADTQPEHNANKPLCKTLDGELQAEDNKHAPWRPTWLPNGFVLASESYSENDGFMQTYTDGLASFSLFLKSPPGIQDVTGNTHIGEGAAQLGASLAFMSVQSIGQDRVHLTVVGEVPPVTAKKVIQSVSGNPLIPSES